MRKVIGVLVVIFIAISGVVVAQEAAPQKVRAPMQTLLLVNSGGQVYTSLHSWTIIQMVEGVFYVTDARGRTSSVYKGFDTTALVVPYSPPPQPQANDETEVEEKVEAPTKEKKDSKK